MKYTGCDVKYTGRDVKYTDCDVNFVFSSEASVQVSNGSDTMYMQTGIKR